MTFDWPNTPTSATGRYVRGSAVDMAALASENPSRRLVGCVSLVIRKAPDDLISVIALIIAST